MDKSNLQSCDMFGKNHEWYVKPMMIKLSDAYESY